MIAPANEIIQDVTEPEEENPVIHEVFHEEESVQLPLMRFENRMEEEEVFAGEEEQYIAQREIVFDLDLHQNDSSGEEKVFMADRQPETIISKTSIQPETPRISPAPGSGNDSQEFNRMGNDRIQKLKALSEKLKNHTPIENNLYELESVPAYKRRNIDLPDVTPSSESQIHGLSLNEDSEKGLEIRSENSFLHKNVD